MQRLLLLLALALPTTAATAAEHHHHAPAAEGRHALSLDHGHKWATDLPLRAHMETLRAHYADKLAQIHAGKLSAAEYQHLAATTRAEMAGIVAECRLPAQADAMLHLLVSDLLAAADRMDGRSKGKPVNGAQRAVRALNHYGEFFDHPGWESLKAPHAT